MPFRVDYHPSDDRIDAEIIGHLRRSRLVVADVTGERPSVYYEAGFAQGLGVPVIWCCNESWHTVVPEKVAANSAEPPDLKIFFWKDRLHFDVRQFPHLFWREPSDLRQQIEARIRFLGLDLPVHGRELRHS